MGRGHATRALGMTAAHIAAAHCDAEMLLTLAFAMPDEPF
jgi:hypothetical protein